MKHVKEASQPSESVLETNKMSVPKPKPAVYAPRPPSPPPELNTLVPEDFNFVDFSFNSIKKKPGADENNFMQKIVKTDDSFQKLNIDDSVKENEEVAKNSAPGAEEKSTKTVALITDSTAQKTEQSKDTIIVEEPLMKVSDARKSIEPTAMMMTSKSEEPDKSSKQDLTAKEVLPPPPPLPTNTAHLVAVRESLKPSLLPVKPVNGAPSSEPPTKDEVNNLALEKSKKSVEELEKLKKDLDDQKRALEKEIELKRELESRLESYVKRSGELEEAVKSKEEIIRHLQDDHKRTNIELLEARDEKKGLEISLEKAEAELANISEANAKAYLEKSDEVNGFKDEILNLTVEMAEKNASIKTLEDTLKTEMEAKSAMLQKDLEDSAEYDRMEDELIKMVEQEIMRMQDTLDEQHEYNTKLQTEVDSEYAYWKKRLSEIDK